MSIRLGPMVHFRVEGESCTEISQALLGFEELNKTVDEMFSDLAERVYPDVGEGSADPTAPNAQ